MFHQSEASSCKSKKQMFLVVRETSEEGIEWRNSISKNLCVLCQQLLECLHFHILLFIASYLLHSGIRSVFISLTREYREKKKLAVDRPFYLKYICIIIFSLNKLRELFPSAFHWVWIKHSTDKDRGWRAMWVKYCLKSWKMN